MTLSRTLWLTSALAALTVGCGDLSTSDAGTGCTTDANCSTGKVCHPVLKACIPSCTAAADCPASAKTCARFDGTAATTAAPGFCQCATAQLCGGGQVCSTATKRCEAQCTSTSCPSGFTCETASGQCRSGGGGDAGVACSTALPQPDTCSYGQACFTDMKCGPVESAGCDNITQAISKGNFTAWNPATSTGPIIYVHTDDTDVQADCMGATDTAFTVTLYAYAGAGTTFPANKSNLQGFSYFTTAGNKTDIPIALLKPSNYAVSNGGKNMSAKFTLCGAAGLTSIQAGFAFTNGNPYCATLSR